MGTLTGGEVRIPGQCEHKLPASCRLSSIPRCCACADERAHASSYSTYVDGVGFVPWGTRWQRYCWFCREFWEQRVSVSGLRPAQTRIPEVPDQTEFLERWYEFHRGYRIVQKEDGTEERVAVLGEDFKDVDPGCLPRTLDELRAGRAASEVAPVQTVVQIEEQQDTGPSLDEALDQMFEDAVAEETSTSARQPVAWESGTADQNQTQDSSAHFPAVRSNIHSQVMTAAGTRNREYQARRIAALRRELHRMRNGIERVIAGLRDLGEMVPEHQVATGPLAALGDRIDAISGPASAEAAREAIAGVNALTITANMSSNDRALANMQTRVDDARREMEEARRNREQAAAELDNADQEFRLSQQRLQQVQREQRTGENYMRIFGTREEMVAAGESYESPISGMFSRAYERFRAAEEVRQQERTLRRVLADEEAGGEQQARHLTAAQGWDRDVWGVPRPPQPSQPLLQTDDEPPEEPRSEIEEYYALLRRQDWTQRPAGDFVTAEDLPPRPASGTGPLFDTASREPAPDPSLPEQAILASSVPTAESDWQLDAELVLKAAIEKYESDGDLLERNRYKVCLERLVDHTLTTDDQRLVRGLLNTEAHLWYAEIPAARLQRLRERNQQIAFQPGALRHQVTAFTHNVEIMAEAFQMSAEVRSKVPGLTASQKLQMLYQLQTGQRSEENVHRLIQMLEDPDTLSLAGRIHANYRTIGDRQQQEIDEQRQVRARQGDHSRQELDAQRRATRAFAVAAGRTAMLTSPQALMERMAAQDNETRAAYDRLRENAWWPQGNTADERALRSTTYRPLNISLFGGDDDDDDDSGDSSHHEEEEVGLDAPDTGRPDPKTDEDMNVSMECRICFTQLAEIACLPCGHLVMCKWCSEQHSPVMQHDRTRPRRAAGCPVCRKGIRQKVRVFRA